MNKPPQAAGFRLVLGYITPHRRVLLAVLALLLAGSALSLANPWMAGLLTASVMGDEPPALGTRALLGLWLGLMVLGGLQGFATQYFIGSTGERITAEMRTSTCRPCRWATTSSAAAATPSPCSAPTPRSSPASSPTP